MLEPTERFGWGDGRRGRIAVRLAEHEKQLIQDAADAVGLRPSSWIRLVVVEAARRKVEGHSAADATKEVDRL